MGDRGKDLIAYPKAYSFGSRSLYALVWALVDELVCFEALKAVTEVSSNTCRRSLLQRGAKRAMREAQRDAGNQSHRSLNSMISGASR